jgi:hypothetical protein
MADTLWSQDFFCKGELSPLMYSRITLNGYYQGMKLAKNVLCLPQGGAAKRFGTRYLARIIGPTDYREIYFKSFPYLNECTYLVVFISGQIQIFLEGELIALVSSPIVGDQVRLIDHTVLDTVFRVTTGIYRPKDLVRTSNAANAIIGFTSSTLTITTPITLNQFYPARFTATTMPTTTPQIYAGRTYFVRAVTTTTVEIYETAQNAASQTNPFVIASAGTAANLFIQNTWTFNDVSFSNLPVFDFDKGYSASGFTPNATSGYGKTIARTSGTYVTTTKLVGGIFVGNGGVARITAVPNTTDMTVDIIQPFNNTDQIPGTLVLITEPAWSNARGWPKKCSSFQNRAFFANTDLLSNGIWASTVNLYNDFDETSTDDDAAISWFPSSDTVNYINFIVPYRSLTVHSNSGIYSTPLSIETAITPKNFSLAFQDSSPANAVEPQGIDNQIIVISGNDVYSMLWDGFNNAYTSGMVSIENEHLIRTPIDQAPYVDRDRSGSKYMFIVNEDGSLAIYQTLITESVSGFTKAVTEQSWGNAYFRWVTSSNEGRAWFVIEREIPLPQTPDALAAASGTTFSSTSYAFDTDTYQAVIFTAAANLVTSPQIVTTRYYWAVGIGGFDFKVYLTKEDAEADVNSITVTSYTGAGSTIEPFELTTEFLIEELDFDAKVDSAGFYEGTPTSSISLPAGASRFNAQELLINGDGFGFTGTPFNSVLSITAHGQPVEVSEAQYGHGIDWEFQPMPLSISTTGNPKSSNLIDPKRLRAATFTFVDTIGGTITTGTNTTPIVFETTNVIVPGKPPTPQNGAFEISLMGGWDDFTYNSFTINHFEPFDIKLTGIFYKVDM